MNDYTLHVKTYYPVQCTSISPINRIKLLQLRLIAVFIHSDIFLYIFVFSYTIRCNKSVNFYPISFTIVLECSWNMSRVGKHSRKKILLMISYLEDQKSRLLTSRFLDIVVVGNDPCLINRDKRVDISNFEGIRIKLQPVLDRKTSNELYPCLWCVKCETYPETKPFKYPVL